MKTLTLKNPVSGQKITAAEPPYVCRAEDLLMDSYHAGNISLEAMKENIEDVSVTFTIAYIALDIFKAAHTANPQAFADLFGDSVTINEE